MMNAITTIPIDTFMKDDIDLVYYSGLYSLYTLDVIDNLKFTIFIYVNLFYKQ